MATVPSSDEASSAQPSSAVRPLSAGSSKSDARRALRILVVDDLVDAAESFAILLRRLGHTAQTAYDGMAALATASQFAPQVILLDIGMPKLNGYRVAEQIRQHPELQSACLIALSGFGQANDVEAARAAGFDHHFGKPIQPASLLPILESVAANQDGPSCN